MVMNNFCKPRRLSPEMVAFLSILVLVCACAPPSKRTAESEQTKSDSVFNKPTQELKDQSPEVRRLLGSLNDNNPDIRLNAAFALGEVDQPSIVGPLIRAVKDRDSGVREEAVNALRKTSSVTLNTALAAMESDSRSRAEAVLHRANLLPTAPLSATEFPTPRLGLAHVTGSMMYRGRLRKGVPIYLHRIDPDIISYKPSTWTDDNGRWRVLNVRPGSYITTCFKPQSIYGFITGLTMSILLGQGR